MYLNNHPILVPDNCQGLFVRTPSNPDAWNIDNLARHAGELEKTIDGLHIVLEPEDRLCIITGEVDRWYAAISDRGLNLTITPGTEANNLVVLRRSGHSARLDEHPVLPMLTEPERAWERSWDIGG